MPGNINYISPGSVGTSVGSGEITSGSVFGFFGPTRHIASGTVGSFDFASGGITSGYLATCAVSSGNICSGQVGWPHLASGAVRSGHIGDSAVNSGNIASGSVGTEHIADGTIIQVDIGSGAVGSGALSSGSVSQFKMASGAVNSGHIGSGAVLGQAGGGAFCIASGTVGFNDIASGAVRSGTIASGSISRFHHASGAITSGHIAPGSVLGDSAGAPSSIAVGTIDFVDIAAQGIGSGNYASGSIAWPHLSSGCILSGHVASGTVQGFAGSTRSVASGTLGTYDFSSGTIVRAASFVSPIQSGTGWQLVTEEIISGVRAVCISQSGNLRIAMASVSGRMPAIGVVFDNVLSGINANVYSQGLFQFTSGLADYSGYLGKTVWVGRSGSVVQWSGSFNSGGLNMASGGDFIQRLGFAVNSGAAVLNVSPHMAQTQLLGVIGLDDVADRQFGV